MGTADLRVYSIEAWAKYTGAANYAQHLHRDYLGASLLVPSSDLQFGQVEVFLYLCDVPVELGPPAFVALRHAADLPMIPNWFPPRTGAAASTSPPGFRRPADLDLYEHEVRAAGPLGTSRPTPTGPSTGATQLTAPGGARYTLHINFRPVGSEWQNRHSWLAHANTPGLVGLPRAGLPTPTRPLGWPPPGHPFWTTATIASVQQRYPGIDAAPWRTALHHTGQAGRQE